EMEAAGEFLDDREAFLDGLNNKCLASGSAITINNNCDTNCCWSECQGKDAGTAVNEGFCNADSDVVDAGAPVTTCGAGRTTGSGGRAGTAGTPGPAGTQGGAGGQGQAGAGGGGAGGAAGTAGGAGNAGAAGTGGAAGGAGSGAAGSDGTAGTAAGGAGGG